MKLSELVRVDPISPGVAVVTLDRPQKRNALSKELLGQLSKVLAELAVDSRLRCAVLTGAGPAFCAGVDLVELGDPSVTFGPGDLTALRSFPLPIVGAINGAAATGGLELALACDFRIASERALFADTHAQVGGVPAWGLTARLPQAVGQGWARQMSFTGEFIDAIAALQIGLVNDVVPHDELLPRAVGIAESIAAASAPAVARIRESYDRGRDGTGADSLAWEVVPEGQLGHVSKGASARR
jgi:enoyl-CoA hydratase